MEANRALRYKLFHKIGFFQVQKGASFSRSFRPGKKFKFISKGFSLPSRLKNQYLISNTQQ
jgi:hypothetical protein